MTTPPSPQFELRKCPWPTPWGEVEALGLFPILNADSVDHEMVQPTIIDFMSNAFLHRVRRGVGGETLIRGTGAKESERSGRRAIDATAGLGQDAALLAVAGFHVTMFERDPLLHAMLADALHRVHAIEGRTPSALDKLRENLNLLPVPADFVETVREARHAEVLSDVDLIYLDPMFEEVALLGKADTKRDLSRLRKLHQASASPNSDETSAEAHREILAAAQAVAHRRVLVKRPLRAPCLVVEPRPHGQVEGKIARFDIYPGRSSR